VAEIYDLHSYRAVPPSQNNPPLTRNQQILAKIQAMWAARTPEQIHQAAIRGTEEELLAVLRRYSRLLNGGPPHPLPSEIAENNGNKPPDSGRESANDHDAGNSM
jgi:hypothetical protein